MPRQDTHQTFIPVLLALVLPSCSLSAFSSGVKEIEIIHKTRADTDTYTVAEKSEPKEAKNCVDHVWPKSVEITPEDDDGSTMHIRYLSAGHYCDIERSMQLFGVKSKEHPLRRAEFWWIKDPGQDPHIRYSQEHMDRFRLLSVDESDRDHIKIYIGYDGQP